MSAHHALAAALALDLRTPLSRISLAVQQWARESDRPADSLRAAGIADAIAEIDSTIDRMLPLLVRTEGEHARAPVSEALTQVRERLAPALRAINVQFEVAPGDLRASVADQRMRHLATELVRAGAQWLNGAGTLRLHADGPESALELCLEAHPLAPLRPRATGETFAAEIAPLADAWQVETSTDALMLRARIEGP